VSFVSEIFFFSISMVIQKTMGFSDNLRLEDEGRGLRVEGGLFIYTGSYSKDITLRCI
jgi:hypothetical protein